MIYQDVVLIGIPLLPFR